jgi:hypothetical protein
MTRTRSIALATAAAALALAACTPEFDPASHVDGLRVLAIRAAPAEIDPAGAATLESLVLRGDFARDPSRQTTIVHLACVPVPGDAAPTPCVSLANLQDPAATIAAGVRRSCEGAGAGAPWPPVTLAGLESCAGAACGPAEVGGAPLPPARLEVPAGFAFPAAGPERILGVQAVVLAFALDATPDELVAGSGTTCPAGDVAANLARLWPAREHVLATKRVVIRGPEAPDAPNRNPAVDGISTGGLPFDPTGPTTLAPGVRSLSPVAAPGPDGQPEVFHELDASGATIEVKAEEWTYSWFSTVGELKDLHTHGAETEEWTASVAPGTRAKVAVVVRDLRGGTGWAVREVVFGP